MAAEIVVVKGSRRRAFAILWEAPAWLRALLGSLRRLPSRPDSHSTANPAGTRPPGAAAAIGGTSLPALAWQESGTHGCVGCGRCVEVCPSRSLVIELEGEGGTPGDVRRFELEPGRCIACGFCAGVCPEGALFLVEGSGRIGTGAWPELRGIVDLLQVAG